MDVFSRLGRNVPFAVFTTLLLLMLMSYQNCANDLRPADEYKTSNYNPPSKGAPPGIGWPSPGSPVTPFQPTPPTPVVSSSDFHITVNPTDSAFTAGDSATLFADTDWPVNQLNFQWYRVLSPGSAQLMTDINGDDGDPRRLTIFSADPSYTGQYRLIITSKYATPPIMKTLGPVTLTIFDWPIYDPYMYY